MGRRATGKHGEWKKTSRQEIGSLISKPFIDADGILLYQKAVADL
jgi:hypothetical protein